MIRVYVIQQFLALARRGNLVYLEFGAQALVILQTLRVNLHVWLEHVLKVGSRYHAVSEAEPILYAI